MITRFGLLGYKLSHSFSQRYFTDKFTAAGIADRFRYDNFPLDTIDKFPDVLKNTPGLRGLNVTIPYKEVITSYLDEWSDAAKEIGAINTILIEDGKLKGYNTDVIGFGDSLDSFLAQNGGPSKMALVLGTGGAAKAVAWVLKQQGIPFLQVSRRKKADILSYEDLENLDWKTVDLIVNTTPLGMYPDVDTCPDLPYHRLTKQHRLYDLVYNPTVTKFMQKGIDKGAATINGLPMLEGQAEAAWSIWTNEG